MSGKTAALGVRAHTRWAIVVAVTGSVVAPQLLDRRKIPLLDDSVPAAPFHVAVEEGLDLESARRLIRRCEERAIACAETSLTAALSAVEAEGYKVVGVGIVAKDRAIPEDLSVVLRSHQLLHASEGELYEEALCEAASRLGHLVERLNPRSATVRPPIAALGRVVGAPWQIDHKLAAEAAFTLLSRGRRSR